jgi:integrase/recombinase XerC
MKPMTVEHAQLLQEYETSARERYREETRNWLRRGVKKLIGYAEGLGVGVHEMTVRQARGYLGSLMVEGKAKGGKYSASALLGFMAAAVSLYDFLKRRGKVLTNPFKEIRRVREARPLPRNIPKEKELAAFLDALGKYDECGSLREAKMRYRVHVIAELMYATGLRVREVAGLKPGDVDLARSIVNVREGKGGRARVAFLTEYACEVLRLYVEKMRLLIFNELNRNRGEYLFGAGWKNFRRTVNRYLTETARKVGLPKMTSHFFRHALGYHLLRAGCNIRYIQQILGHQSLKNTEVYTKVDKESLRKVLDNCHPRRWKRRTDEVGLGSDADIV